MKTRSLLLTCEHGGNRIPARYAERFRGGDRLLRGHRGYDTGALATARILARRLKAPLVSSTTSRLLVDLNRSEGHPQAFSRFTRGLPREERERILDRHYRPFRRDVESRIRRARRCGVLHVSVHSFAPVVDGRRRTADLALLYDPQRAPERLLCARWTSALHDLLPGYRIRRNYPYRGRADGHTTHLRRIFPAEEYAGIELELGQGILEANRPPRKVVEALLVVLRGE